MHCMKEVAWHHQHRGFTVLISAQLSWDTSFAKEATQREEALVHGLFVFTIRTDMD